MRLTDLRWKKKILHKIKRKQIHAYISGLVNGITDDDELLNKNSFFVSKPFKLEDFI